MAKARSHVSNVRRTVSQPSAQFDAAPYAARLEHDACLSRGAQVMGKVRALDIGYQSGIIRPFRIA